MTEDKLSAAKSGDECSVLERLLRRRGVLLGKQPEVEREIIERYQDDCAVLVLDSSGFTRVTKKHGIVHFLSLVVAMRDICRPLFEAHEAISHWPHCDNMFAVFPTARQAVRCAVAIQEGVRAENEKRPPESRLEVCIGVGSGRLLRIGTEDVYGDEMNVASKLGEDVAEPGEILLTRAAFEEISNKVDGLRTEMLTTHISGVEIPYYSMDTASALTWKI